MSSARPNPVTPGPVVVGVGRSAAGRAAVTWAADEAAVTGRALRLVHAVEWSHRRPGEGDPQLLAAHVRAGGDLALAQARALVEEYRPGLVTEVCAAEGPRARVLLEQAADAALLVVGVKHRPLLEQVLALPALGVPLSAHAPCPVAVVREPLVTAEPLVVVGTDGSKGSLPALELAFARAEESGDALRVVQAYGVWPELTPGARTEAAGYAELELAALTAGLRARHPRVEVEHKVVLGRPVGVLLHESARARCLVVGSRGFGGFRGLLLGSVSHALVEHATCPLIVVPSHGEH
jgi:nucleotide-binding universal stress UspA family protein